MKQAETDVNGSITSATYTLFQIKALADSAGALLLHECRQGESDESVVSARMLLNLISGIADESATALGEVSV